MNTILLDVGEDGKAKIKEGLNIRIDVALGGIEINDDKVDTRADAQSSGSLVKENPAFYNFSSAFNVVQNDNGADVGLGQVSIDIEEDGASLISASAINFGSLLTASDDGDGTVTVTGTDTHIDVENDGGSVLTDISALNFGNYLVATSDGDGSATVNATEQVSFETGHAQWADGLSNAEIYRINLQSGETLTLDRLEAQLNGGGTASNLSVDVYDVTAGSVIDSTTAGAVSTSGGSSGSGNVVIVRVSNSTGNTQEANFVVRGEIT